MLIEHIHRAGSNKTRESERGWLFFVAACEGNMPSFSQREESPCVIAGRSENMKQKKEEGIPGIGVDSDRASDLRRRDLYQSTAFRAEASRLLGVDQSRLDTCLDVLLASNTIPRSGPGSTEVTDAEDAAFILAGLGTCTTDATTLLHATKRILFMEFQCEFGEEATDDRKGRRREPSDPYKDLFGNQLSKTIRDVWADEDGGSFAAVTIGWGLGHPTAYGSVEFHSPYREATFLYSTAYMFPDLHEGIGAFRGLELKFARKIEVSANVLRSLGRLLRDDGSTPRPRYIIADPATNTGWTHLFERKIPISGRLSDAIVELECRFVYYVPEQRLLHLDVMEKGIAIPGSEDDLCDLEDSLNYANPDALRDPWEAGLDVRSQPPAWYRRK